MMKADKFNRLFKAVFFAAFILSGQRWALAQREDAAVWAGLQLEKAVFRKNITGHIKVQGRLNENFTHIDYSFIDGGLSYTFNKYVTTTASYVLNFKNSPLGNNWSGKEQFYVNAQLKYKYKKLKLTDRNQLQTDLEDSRFSTGDWFYRNKIGLSYSPFKHWSFAGSFESYFRLGPKIPPEKSVYRKRFAAGVSYDLSKKSSIELGYLIQEQIRAKQPDYIYAITIGYSYSFGGTLFKIGKKQDKPEVDLKDIDTQ